MKPSKLTNRQSLLAILPVVLLLAGGLFGTEASVASKGDGDPSAVVAPRGVAAQVANLNPAAYEAEGNDGRASSAPLRKATKGAGVFLRGYADSVFGAADPAERGFWLDQVVRANSGLVRLNVSWRGVAQSQPSAPQDPGDTAYAFDEVDRVVRDAASRGLRVLLTVYDAPRWAEGPNRPAETSEYPAGTWKPDPQAFGDFGQAIASRYSGSFVPLGSLSPLPEVEFLEGWNEPNLTEYISPQSINGKIFSADHLRAMLSAFSEGIDRSTNPNAKVVLGGTSPYGDPVGGRRTRPLQFLRDLFCLDRKLKRTKGCKKKADFDILAHHPITLSGGPNRSAIHDDDAAMPDFKNVVRTLRAAERRNTVVGKKHPAWVTEFWWETKPPDGAHGVPIQRHARWVQTSLYSLWKQGASAAVWFQILDNPMDADGGGLQAGHFFYPEETAKPAFEAFRFPFVPDRVSNRKVNVWTIGPADGTVQIQQKRGNGFKTVDRMSVRDGVPEQTKVRLGGKPVMRGVLNGEASLTSKP